jgi:hypothetical protein
MERRTAEGRWKGPRSFCLLIMVCAGGCRNPGLEVPPGKPYATTSTPPPSVEFSSEPHPSLGTLEPASPPGRLARDDFRGAPGSGDRRVYGTPTPGTLNLGAPTDHHYGPPGTSGTDPTSPGGPSQIAQSLLEPAPTNPREPTTDFGLAPASGSETR